MILRTLLESLFLFSCGVFYLLDTIVINSLLYIALFVNVLLIEQSWATGFGLLEAFVFMFFNIYETLNHSKFESKSFYSKIVANKLSIQYIKFVNRLLPKHVGLSDADPAEHDSE